MLWLPTQLGRAVPLATLAWLNASPLRDPLLRAHSRERLPAALVSPRVYRLSAPARDSMVHPTEKTGTLGELLEPASHAAQM